MKLLNFAVITMTLCLIFGIWIADSFLVSLEFSIGATLISFVTLFVVYFLSRKTVERTLAFTVTSYITTILLGILIYNLHSDVNHPSHYTSQTIKENDKRTIEIVERLKPSVYHTKYVVELKNIGNKGTTGQLLLNVTKQFNSESFSVGQQIVTFEKIEGLPIALNPHQFDYSKYLERQQIHHQLTVSPNQLLVLENSDNSLRIIASKIRDRINRNLKVYDFKPDELAVINALLLGQRQDMDIRVYNDYVNAGAVHILAVSGLHVGIIWLIISYLLRPLRCLRFGKWAEVLITLILLWSFAIIAGLSPSVTRAVTMFSVITLAKLINRPTNIYNTLATSALILLLFEPRFLFQVGFQMSYLAVFGIVTFRPILVNLYYPENRIGKFFYNIIIVSLAAQLGVLPLSLFYFHQFPALFLVSNLFILPFLGVILGFGIVIIAMALLSIPNNPLVDLYAWLISLMNKSVNWVAQQESFLFADISFDTTMMIAAYVCVIGIYFIVRKMNLISIAFLILSFLILQGVWNFQKFGHSERDLIVFHKTRQSIIAEKQSNHLRIFSSLTEADVENEPILKNYQIGSNTHSSQVDSLKYLYEYKNDVFLVIDGLAIWNYKSIKPNIIILRDSPKINLSRIIDSIHPEIIIADGSNYPSYITKWKATAMKKNTILHSTRDDGYFSVSEFDKK